ncbi:MAG: hypothetical protein CMLOHMNK_02582 [Steroidobacteraceae bacterium]|nr:hypothetical protein [Steroidobacteraceae bacterium]
MASVVYSARSIAHIERAFEFLRGKNPAAAATAIRTAVETLALHPLIGRRIEGDLRELVISYGDCGYIAVYRFLVGSDEVRVLAIRRQREIGYVP